MNPIHRPHAAVHAMLTVKIDAALKVLEGEYTIYTAHRPTSRTSRARAGHRAIAGGEDRTVTGAEVRIAIEISD